METEVQAETGAEHRMLVRAAKRQLIDSARALLEMTDHELWVAAFGAGGNVQLDELTGFLRGYRDLAEHDYDSIAAALNDMLSDAGLARSVPFSAALSAELTE